VIALSRAAVTYRGEGGPHPALAGVDLSIARGEPFVIIGPSGCGKTTLLYLLAGLVAPSSGTAEVAGLPVAGPRRETSLILQQHGLFPWKNAADNVALGLTLRHVPRAERETRVRALMEELRIADVAKSFPAQLSGGQRQRVAIARSLATAPDLLLMDEPFSSLDLLTREQMQDLLLALWREKAFTFVLVTHGIEEAAFLGRRIAVLSPRPGRVAALLDNPGAGDPAYRESPGFHRMGVAIRRALEGTLGGAGR
jgi:NitT/TauT family transport system ATP-binding protein